MSAPASWTRGSGWGWIWGDDDRVGALNAVTPASILDALSLVSRGRVFDLGLTMDRGSFVGPFHAHTEVLTFRTAEDFKREQELDGDGVSFNTAVVLISDHAGTQIDGLCHAVFGDDNHWYNGYRSTDARTDFGAAAANASEMPPIILSAVMLDVAAHEGVDCLDPASAIGVDRLSETMRAQGTEIQPCDAVFVRTGALGKWGDSDQTALREADTAGITLAAARWLVEEHGAILIGSDTSTLEVMPPVDGDNISPVHKYLLVDQGVHIGELHYLEELSAAVVHRFCYVALTPKLRGTTAGFALRPIALV